jgi:hypothetical protein
MSALSCARSCALRLVQSPSVRRADRSPGQVYRQQQLCVHVRASAFAVGDAENPSNAGDTAAAAAAPAARTGAVAAGSAAGAAAAATAAGATQRGAGPAHAAAGAGGASSSNRPPDAPGAAAAGEPCSPAAGAGRGNAAVVSPAPPAHPGGSPGVPEGASSGIHLSPSELAALQDVLAALMDTPSRRLQREAAMGGECMAVSLSALKKRVLSAVSVAAPLTSLVSPQGARCRGRRERIRRLGGRGSSGARDVSHPPLSEVQQTTANRSATRVTSLSQERGNGSPARAELFAGLAALATPASISCLHLLPLRAPPRRLQTRSSNSASPFKACQRGTGTSARRRPPRRRATAC